MTSAPFAHPRFAPPWTSEIVSWSDSGGKVVLRREDGLPTAVELVRCVNGRLRLAYPVGARDVEARIPDVVTPEDLTSVLLAVVPAILASDQHCRKVVFAVNRHEPVSALAEIAAAEAAGFRYVVDIDLAGAELSLLVAEPVRIIDIELDYVPGT